MTHLYCLITWVSCRKLSCGEKKNHNVTYCYSTYITFLKWYSNRNQQSSGCQRLQRQCGEWEENKWDGYNGIRNSTCADENVWCFHCKCSSCDRVMHFFKMLSLGRFNKGYKRFPFLFSSLIQQPPLPLLLQVPPSTAILCNSCSKGMSIYY